MKISPFLHFSYMENADKMKEIQVCNKIVRKA